MFILRLAFSYTVFVGLALALSAPAPRRLDSLNRRTDGLPNDQVGEMIVGEDPATGRPLSITGAATPTQEFERRRHHFAATKRFRFHGRQAMTSNEGVKAQAGLMERDDENEVTQDGPTEDGVTEEEASTDNALAEEDVSELNNNGNKSKKGSKKSKDGKKKTKDGDDDKPDKTKDGAKKKKQPSKDGSKSKPDKGTPDPSSNSASSSSGSNSSGTGDDSTNSTSISNSTTPVANTASGSCTFSDVSSLLKGKGSCTDIVLNGIQVPAGTTLDLNGLKPNTRVTFAGTTTFGYKEWDGPLISVADSSHILVTGTSTNMISYGGERWWDGKGGNGGKAKPRAFRVNGLNDITISGLNLKNTPMMAFSVSKCTGLTFDKISLDNADGLAGKKSKNGDGFDISHSQGVMISNNDMVTTDDCVAINDGSGIHVTNNFCRFTHGIAISVREGSKVNNVIIENNRVADGRFGLRIKARKGESASVSNVQFRNNVLSGITNASIELAQNYINGAPYAEELATSSAPFTDISFSGIQGSVIDSAAKFEIACGPGACTGFSWSNSQITGGKKASICKNAPKEIPCSQG